MCPAEAAQQRHSDAVPRSMREAVAFAHLGSKRRAPGASDDTNEDAVNRPELSVVPLAKDCETAPTAYKADVAADKVGDDVEDEQQREDEGVASEQSESHDHAKDSYYNAVEEAEHDPASSEKDDQIAPSPNDHNPAPGTGGDAGQDELEQAVGGAAFVQPESHGHAKGVPDDIEDEVYTGPDPSAKYDKNVPFVCEVPEDEGAARVHFGSYGRAKGSHCDTGYGTDNGPEPAAKDDKNARTPYDAENAVDRGGHAEENGCSTLA